MLRIIVFGFIRFQSSRARKRARAWLGCTKATKKKVITEEKWTRQQDVGWKETALRKSQIWKGPSVTNIYAAIHSYLIHRSSSQRFSPQRVLGGSSQHENRALNINVLGRLFFRLFTHPPKSNIYEASTILQHSQRCARCRVVEREKEENRK